MKRLALVALLAACSQPAGPAYRYPDNSTLARSAFVAVSKAVESLQITEATRVVIRKAPGGDPLVRWSQVVTPEIALATVAPGRMVYEVTAVHARPFTVGPTHYRSGQQTTIVDAQTGTWLITTARGTLASRTMRTP
ncbi:MAG: hypothetical protein WBD74_11135 [Candidatus Aquilonibacter sp.]